MGMVHWDRTTAQSRCCPSIRLPFTSKAMPWWDATHCPFSMAAAIWRTARSLIGRFRNSPRSIRVFDSFSTFSAHWGVMLFICVFILFIWFCFLTRFILVRVLVVSLVLFHPNLHISIDHWVILIHADKCHGPSNELLFVAGKYLGVGRRIRHMESGKSNAPINLCLLYAQPLHGDSDSLFCCHNGSMIIVA